MRYILPLHQGTTSSPPSSWTDPAHCSVEQEHFPQHNPASGKVERDPSALWATTAATARAAIEKARLRAANIEAICITNEGETTPVWDRATGHSIPNAIVWQDRRTVDICTTLREVGHEPMITARTGLLAKDADAVPMISRLEV